MKQSTKETITPQDDIEKTHFYCSGCEMWHLLKDVYCDEQMLCSAAYWEGKDPTEDLRYESQMELERDENEKTKI